MARRDVPLSPDDELPLRPADTPPRRRASLAESEPPDLDPRLLDLEEDDSGTFLRAQKRVPVRRGAIPRKAANRLKQGGMALAIVAVLCAIATEMYRYGAHSWRFRLDSSDQIDISGIHNVTRAQVMDVMGGDIGRNVFFIPLDERKKQLEQIPWVESASVMRLLPNRLRIEIRERTPVAFVRIHSKISLIDAAGVVMDLPPGSAKDYSFPVIVGAGDSEPLSTRAPRMKIYERLISDLDSGGARLSQSLSEVDLSDPEDVKVVADDPGGQVLVHLGASHFLDRFRIFQAHVRQWRQQFQKLDSVDLRYDREVIVNPDSDAAGNAPAVAKLKGKRK